MEITANTKITAELVKKMGPYGVLVVAKETMPPIEKGTLGSIWFEQDESGSRFAFTYDEDDGETVEVFESDFVNFEVPW